MLFFGGVPVCIAYKFGPPNLDLGSATVINTECVRELWNCEKHCYEFHFVLAIPTWKFLIPPQPKFHFILVRFSHFGLFRLILARALISVGTDRAKHLPYLSTLWLLSTTLPVTWMNPSHGKGCIFFVLSAGHSSVRFWIFLYLDLSFLFCSVSLDSWLGIGNDKGGLKKVSGFIFVGPYVIY